MEKFLGVLFCGGRGKRLGEITKYISKTFVPVYDRPVFKYGLQLLDASVHIDEILILTNDENDEKLKHSCHETLIQDDNEVYDMFSGWEYIKKRTGTKKHGVLVPGDNVSNIQIDNCIEVFLNCKTNLLFSIFEINDRRKLAQMGCYDISRNKFFYKHTNPPTTYGVIAPYIIENSITISEGDQILDHPESKYLIHKGYWFDVGDYQDIIEASLFIKNLENDQSKDHLSQTPDT